MADSHATSAQLAAWLGSTAPDDADRLLARASTVVDTAVIAPYKVDEDGHATDVDVDGALVDATCAQVEFWLHVGEEHDIEGVRGDVSTPGTSFTLPGTVAPRAASILSLAGLTRPTMR